MVPFLQIWKGGGEGGQEEELSGRSLCLKEPNVLLFNKQEELTAYCFLPYPPMFLLKTQQYVAFASILVAFNEVQ